MTAAPAPVEARVECGGGTHRLRWTGGHLRALDHPDTEGERLLVALGGGRPECLEILESWDVHREDVRLLTLGPRHGGDLPVVATADLDAVRHGHFANNVRHGRAARAQMPAALRARGLPGDSLDDQEEHLHRHLALLRLFTLPAVLQQRLGAAVAATWWARDPDTPALQAAVVGRARPALRAWAGGDVAVHFRVGPATTVARTDDGEAVEAELPTRWLVDVWSRDLALVDGHFGLEVLDGDQLRAVAPDGSVVVRPLGPG